MKTCLYIHKFWPCRAEVMTRNVMFTVFNKSLSGLKHLANVGHPRGGARKSCHICAEGSGEHTLETNERTEASAWN